MIRRAVLLLLLFSCCTSFAQKAAFSFFAGAGLAYVKHKGEPHTFEKEYEQETTSRFYPIITPHAELRYTKRVAARISFETGIGYAQRGYVQRLINKTIYPNKDFHQYESYYKTTIDYLRIPVTASYTYPLKKTAAISFCVGMDYGFAVHVQQKGYFVNSYASGEYSRQDYQRKPEIKLLAGENRLANYTAY